MSHAERRATERKPVSFPVTVATEAVVLEGRTLNSSGRGLLLHARGNISVLVSVKGQEYRGRLVRAAPVDSETIAYAVELVEDIPEDAWSAA